MFNKILIFLPGALASILIVQNLAMGTNAFVFLERNSNTGTLAIISCILGCIIGFGIKSFLSEQKEDIDESLDF